MKTCCTELMMYRGMKRQHHQLLPVMNIYWISIGPFSGFNEARSLRLVGGTTDYRGYCKAFDQKFDSFEFELHYEMETTQTRELYQGPL